MAKSKTSEEIIEKKDSSPVATASLIVSCVALIGAVWFCVDEIMTYRQDLSARVEAADSPGTLTAKNDLRELRTRVSRILSDEAPGERDEEDTEDDEDMENDEDMEDDEDFDDDMEDDEDFDDEEEEEDL